MLTIEYSNGADSIPASFMGGSEFGSLSSTRYPDEILARFDRFLRFWDKFLKYGTDASAHIIASLYDFQSSIY
jgi:hypothetical protein